MKVLLVLLVFVLSPASAQVKKTELRKITPVTPAPARETFSDRLSIGYFGAFSSPTFRDMDKGRWENAATSPQFGDEQNRDSVPVNLWNQLSFNYKFSPKLGFIINPRWTTQLAHPVDRNDPEDTALFSLEDTLVGVQGVVYTSEDKKFNLWVRPGFLLPTSHPSRKSENRGFGTLTYLPEVSYSPTYDFNKTWQLGVFGIIRMWVYEDRFNDSRFRFYTAPFIRYSFDDDTRLQVFYEHMLENNRRRPSINGLQRNYSDVWQNIMIGINQDLSKKLNVYPFLGAFVDDVPFSTESLWLGAWVSYQLK